MMWLLYMIVLERNEAYTEVFYFGILDRIKRS